MRKPLLIAALAYGVVSLISYMVGGATQAVEYRDPVIQLEYCPMWEIWHADKAQGKPIEQRHGYPDQGGRYFEECNQ